MSQAVQSAPVVSDLRPSLMGIWRLGDRIHRSDVAELCLAQPADAISSPRWDYVLKRAIVCDRDQESRRQIERFAQAAAAASHPNLVAVLDGCQSSSTSYLVMPRLEGKTLAAHFQDTTAAVPLPVVLWWTRQIAQALAALHAGGWVHLDVKFENVLVGPRGHVTLLDLGFASLCGEHPRQTFRGTPDFAAPEAITAMVPIHTSMDVFSLGSVLRTWMKRLTAVDERIIDPITELISKMVAEAPQQRPTAETVSRQLLQLEIESLGSHLLPGQVQPSPQQCRAA